MNTISLLLCIIFISVAHSLTQEEKGSIHDECFLQTGVHEDNAAKALDDEFVDDPKLKLYILCFAKKVGLMNDSGEIQLDVLRVKLSGMISDEAKVEEMIAKCVVQKSTPEETIFEVSRCIHGNDS
uniref:Odorant-binding protein 18 n=1 Tax=Monochamus alternatus TaxID=192382 RepID=A0A1I9HZM0_MONAT|nr:odorant-binding protein 18 [Monochamus alternatus]